MLPTTKLPETKAALKRALLLALDQVHELSIHKGQLEKLLLSLRAAGVAFPADLEKRWLSMEPMIVNSFARRRATSRYSLEFREMLIREYDDAPDNHTRLAILHKYGICASTFTRWVRNRAAGKWDLAPKSKPAVPASAQKLENDFLFLDESNDQ